MKRLFSLGICIIFLSLVPSAHAFTTNMSASQVLGQQNFSSTSRLTVNAKNFAYPYGAKVINGKLIVTDYTNNRILIYNSVPTSNYAAADVVIGQPNMTSNAVNQGGSVAANTIQGAGPVDSDGTRLFVTDYDNNRVLIFNHIPTSNNASADVVIGQPNFTTNSTGTTRSKLNEPWGVEYDPLSGKLFIVDYGNSRVLIYNQVPTTNGASADLVLGQADFTSGSINRGGAVAANTLYNPYTVHRIAGKLLVVDSQNNRVLIWNSIPTSNGAAANLVIGQPNLTSNSANQGGIGANTLKRPSDVLYYRGELFIPDANNSRLLIYNGIPSTNNAGAYKVIGQPNFTSSDIHQGATAGANTLGDFSDSLLSIYNDKLYVADADSNRILVFNNITNALENMPSLNVGETSADITWLTSSSSRSTILEYGTNTDYGYSNDTFGPHVLESSHRAILNNLNPCTTYHYRITSAFASGDNIGTSDDTTFTTKGTCSAFSTNWQAEAGTVVFEPAVANNLHTDNYPTFVFNQAQDKQDGISKYQIVVTDSKGIEKVLIDSIPDTAVTETVENDDRYLFYDVRAHRITVKGKAEKYKLEDGAYRWRVLAVNGKGAVIRSASRTLLVNTKTAVFSSPTFTFPMMLLQVGKNKLFYSSYDTASAPTKALSVNSKPTFFGIANAGAHIKMVLTKGTDMFTYEVNANDQSRFGINISPALANGTYLVNLSATNDSGDYVDVHEFSIKVGP